MPVQAQAIQLQPQVGNEDTVEDSDAVQMMCAECEAELEGEHGEVNQSQAESAESGDLSPDQSEADTSENDEEQQPQLIQRETEEESGNEDAKTQLVPGEAEEEEQQPELIQRICAECEGKKNQEENAQPKLIQRDDDENSEPTEESSIAELQTKLTIGAANDHYENEANQVADHIVNNRSVPAISSVANKNIAAKSADVTTANGENKEEQNDNNGGGIKLQEATESDEDTSLQKQSSQNGSSSSGSVTSALSNGGAGNSLNASIKGSMESSTGYSFERVRVHTDSASHKANKALDARAFTHGSDIWLGEGESQNDTRLMAHELTHVVQQNGQPQSIQRAPADYQHPEDGGNVESRIEEKLDVEIDEEDIQDTPPTIDRSEVDAKKAEVSGDAAPDVDRPAEKEGEVTSAAEATEQEANAAVEPLVEGEEASEPGEAEGGGEAAGAQDPSAQMFSAADSMQMPTPETEVVMPEPVAPVDTEGDALFSNPAAEMEMIGMALQAQTLRDQGTMIRAQATNAKANAKVLKGNIAIGKARIVESDAGIETARGHVQTRRDTLGQGREALTVSEEKASTVASEAPGIVDKAQEGKDETGPMASEANEQSAENNSNIPDDPEAAAKARERGGQIDQASNDTQTADDAVSQTKEKAQTLVSDAATAQEKNAESGTKLDEMDETLTSSDEKLDEMVAKNEQAKSKYNVLSAGPAEVEGKAQDHDQKGQVLIQESFQIEKDIHAAQKEFESSSSSIRGIDRSEQEQSETGSEGLIQRDLLDTTGYRDRERVNLGAGSSNPSTEDVQRREEAERLANERRETRLAEIRSRLGDDLSQASAAGKVGLAIELTVRNLFTDAAQTEWAAMLGMALQALVDPRISLKGVLAGLNMTLSGFANVISPEQWAADPIGNALKSAADIVTGITIILASITGLATAALVIMAALCLVSLFFGGALIPILATPMNLCWTVMTVVGGWTIAWAKVALVLQALVLIKNLIFAATADTAEELNGNVENMTEDSKMAAGLLAIIGLDKAMQAGARTPVGQSIMGGFARVGQRLGIKPRGVLSGRPPEGAAPEGAAPEGAAPEGAAPEGAAPEGAAPEGAVPEGAAPEGAVPEGAVPEGAAPEGAAPEGAAPEGAAPEGVAPEGAAPEGATPEGGAPEGGAPEGGAPEGGAPEGTVPEGTVPEGAAPEGAVPEGAAPEGQTPEGQAPEGQAPEGQAPEGQTPDDPHSQLADLPSEGTGAEIASARGLPDAPEGYQWARSGDRLIVRRAAGSVEANNPPVGYDPATRTFAPEINAPNGYHWEPKPGGGYEVRPNPGQSSNLPELDFDASANRFINRGTGDVYLEPLGPGERPSWRESEIQVGNELPGGYREQVSFKGGEEVPYASEGSTRPDWYQPGHSVEVKNYGIETPAGRDALVENVISQAIKRAQHLPSGTRQSVVVDARGQNVTLSQLSALRARIANGSGGNISSGDISFLR